MLKSGPKAKENELSLGQKNKIRNWYVQPYITMVDDALEAIEDKHLKANILKQLIGLVTKEKSQYSFTQRQLTIHEDAVQQDEKLKSDIGKVLQKIPSSISHNISADEIYTPLFKLLHEFRFNKNPDSQSADLINNFLAQNAETSNLYEATYHKTETLARRLLTDGPEVKEAQVEKAVLDIIAEELVAMTPAEATEEKEIVDTLENKTQKKEAKKEKAKPVLHSFKKDNTKERKSLKQEAQDFQFAQSLQQIEHDEILARQLAQEESDEALARKLDREYNHRL